MFILDLIIFCLNIYEKFIFFIKRVIIVNFIFMLITMRWCHVEDIFKKQNYYLRCDLHDHIESFQPG